MSETERTKARVSRVFAPFGTSIFTEMTALATSVGAVNLSQGFPDFEGPRSIRDKAAQAIVRGPNQYVASPGLERLRCAVARKMKRFYGVTVDPATEVTVTAGASEGLAASLLGLLEPGDEVILLEPCYDLYPPMVARAGAKAIFVPLTRPGFDLPTAALKDAFNERTKAVVINNPQNPTGKVFSLSELEFLGSLCKKFDAVAIGDEVYEHLVYDGRRHQTLLQIPDLADRAIVISSTAKTFSMTGWKVGYAVACPELSRAVRMSHQFLTFCTPGALQEAMAEAIEMDDEYYRELLESYASKREKLCCALESMHFEISWPEGTYYTSINIGPLGFDDDLEFCRFLTTEVGVAAVPSSFFWWDRRGGRDLARLCFCKTDDTLNEAIERLGRWKR